MTIPAVLRTLARLSPSEQAQVGVTKAAGLVWLGSDEVVDDVLFDLFDLCSGRTSWTPRPDHRPQADRLASSTLCTARTISCGWGGRSCADR